jgi:hypothetical protein
LFYLADLVGATGFEPAPPSPPDFQLFNEINGSFHNFGNEGKGVETSGNEGASKAKPIPALQFVSSTMFERYRPKEYDSFGP